MDIEYPLLLDGGLSNQLQEQGCDLHHPLWTAYLLDRDPVAIIAAHLAYLQAGARCLITASYQASQAGFIAAGYDQHTYETLLLRSVDLAATAINRHHVAVSTTAPIYIAASIGPYGASLADGSEYRGNYQTSVRELCDFHRQRLEILSTSAADFFACETIPSLPEAEALANCLPTLSKAAWVSFACRDGQHLNDGSDIADAAALFSDIPQAFAIGINCTAPQFISPLLKRLQPWRKTKRLVVYPNAGSMYSPTSKAWGPAGVAYEFAALARKWLHLGADIIGGCCQVTPKDIQAMAAVVRNS
jgi:homocysteine S-methyltransferase